MESPELNLASILNLLGAAQALLLALALLTIRRGNRTGNRLLAGLALTIAILVLGNVLVSTHYLLVFPHLSRVHHPFEYAAAPLLYLYVRELTSGKQGFRKRDLLHFIPSVLCFLYLIPYYLQSSDYKLYNLTSIYYARWYFIRSGITILQALCYMIFIVLRLVTYSRALKSGRLRAEGSALPRLRFLVLSFSAVWVLAAARYLFDFFYPFYMGYTNLVLPLCATFIVYALGYMGLKMPEALTGADKTEDAALAPVKKYEKSSLTPDRAERYLKKLLDVMDTEKPYLNSDLTIQKLAEQLSVPAPHLSQAINERLHQNFSDLVNSYRVEEAKRLLLDPGKKHYSILAIAEEVGFNSKSSFNAVFKKHAGATPSEWRKAVNGGQHHANS